MALIPTRDDDPFAVAAVLLEAMGLLLAHRGLPAAAVDTTVPTEVDAGPIDPQLVLIDARRCTGGQHTGAGSVPDPIPRSCHWAG